MGQQECQNAIGLGPTRGVIIFIFVAIFVDPILLDGRGSYATALPFRAARKPKPTRAFQPAEYKRESDDRDNTETDKDRREKCGSEIQTETDPDGEGQRQEIPGAARREYRLSL